MSLVLFRYIDGVFSLTGWGWLFIFGGGFGVGTGLKSGLEKIADAIKAK